MNESFCPHSGVQSLKSFKRRMYVDKSEKAALEWTATISGNLNMNVEYLWRYQMFACPIVYRHFAVTC